MCTVSIPPWWLPVALRKESVDRNILYPDSAPANWAVALRKESVDRNIARMVPLLIVPKSLSARRAWIEIHGFPFWQA